MSSLIKNMNFIVDDVTAVGTQNIDVVAVLCFIAALTTQISPLGNH